MGNALQEELDSALFQLSKVVSQIREKLEDSPLTPVIAREAARSSGRRGEPVLVVDDRGTVLLEVTYPSTNSDPVPDLTPTPVLVPVTIVSEGPTPEGPTPEEPTPEVSDSSKRAWKTKLPSLSSLREQATALGIDPEPFGRNKRDILKAIQKVSG